jgi:hypothetical protein
MHLDMNIQGRKLVFGITINAEDESKKLRSVVSVAEFCLKNKKPLDKEIYRSIMESLGHQLIAESQNPKFMEIKK